MALSLQLRPPVLQGGEQPTEATGGPEHTHAQVAGAMYATCASEGDMAINTDDERVMLVALAEPLKVHVLRTGAESPRAPA